VANALTGASTREIRDRVGLWIEAIDTADALRRVSEAEAAGVRQVWLTAGGVPGADSLTFCATAAMHTKEVRLGTSIVQIFLRHPIVTAQQALLIDDLAPGRFRLGVGTSHREIIEQRYGLKMQAPLGYLREYVAVLRGILWEGKVDYHGRFFNVVYTHTRRAPVPILVSALGEKAYSLAGEVSDGAISWMCPVPYLLGKALPALQSGAKANHRPVPPLVAQVSVAMSSDEKATRAATINRLKRYTGMAFYSHMFAKAGFPETATDSGLDTLADALAVAGDEAEVRRQLLDLLGSGLDELLIMLVPVTDEEEERNRLLRMIGSL
jgi:F420-dependent oxidoreductase-like protein